MINVLVVAGYIIFWKLPVIASWKSQWDCGESTFVPVTTIIGTWPTIPSTEIDRITLALFLLPLHSRVPEPPQHAVQLDDMQQPHCAWWMSRPSTRNLQTGLRPCGPRGGHQQTKAGIRKRSRQIAPLRRGKCQIQSSCGRMSSRIG